MDEHRVNHPSFGFIRASRVSGYTPLFDSALKHQHYVHVEIGHAEQIIQYGQSHTYNNLRGIISVAMSESQFAQFITSMNVGAGAPCTLEYINGVRVESPPADINTRKLFDEDLKARAGEMLSGVQTALDELTALKAKGKATKAELTAAIDKVTRVQTEMTSNMPFFLRMFAEAMEKHIDRAKMDINAHATMMGQRMLAGSAPAEPIGQIENNTA